MYMCPCGMLTLSGMYRGVVEPGYMVVLFLALKRTSKSTSGILSVFSNGKCYRPGCSRGSHEWFFYLSKESIPILPGEQRTTCSVRGMVSSNTGSEVGLWAKGSRVVRGGQIVFCFLLFLFLPEIGKKASSISLGWVWGHCWDCLEPYNLVSRNLVFCLPDARNIPSSSRDN